MGKADDAGTFVCTQCGAEGAQRSGRGRPFTRCGRCRSPGPWCPPTVVCAECGRPALAHVPGQRYCGRTCQKRASDRERTRRRRALTRTQAVELFDSNDVFERDRWRCQLCGVRTLRSRQGTQHPRAPELDHIMPLSKGGEHTRQNTQCACKACNMAKGGRWLGQLRLCA